MQRKKLFVFFVVLISLAAPILSSAGCSYFFKKEEGKKTEKGRQAPPTKPLTKKVQERIAFSKEGDIWTVRPDGSDKKQLTSNSEYEFSLSYSLKAKRLWFVRMTELAPGEIPVGDVWSIKPDGTGERQITKGLKVRFAVVSPDGKDIALGIFKPSAKISPAGETGPTTDLWIMSATQIKQTEDSPHVDLSSDMPADEIGGREGVLFCSWRPDSRKVVFTFRPHESASLGISTRQIYVANRNGTGRKKIGAGMDHPVYSPDSKYIAVEEGAHWDMIGLKVIKESGDVYKEVLPVPEKDLYSVDKTAWAGSKKIIYPLTTHPAQPEEPVSTLHVVDLDTLEKTSIVKEDQIDNGTPRHPAVNSAGTKIAFEAGYFYKQGGEKTVYIWVVNIDGTGLKMITTGSEDTEPIWIQE